MKIYVIYGFSSLFSDFYDTFGFFQSEEGAKKKVEELYQTYDDESEGIKFNIVETEVLP